VLTFLASVNEKDLIDAFVSLEGRSFARAMEMTQYAEDGPQIARDRRTIIQTVAMDGITVGSEDVQVEGEFSFGRMSDLFGRAAAENGPSPFKAYLIPEDRGYNNPRHENKYLYRFAPDSVVNGRSVRNVEIRVRETARDEVFVQRMLLSIDEIASTVVSITMDTRIKSLLFREKTSFHLSGRWTEGARLEPQGFTLSSDLKSVLSNPVRIRMTSEFSYPDAS
jgi:hypothetical protein